MNYFRKLFIIHVYKLVYKIYLDKLSIKRIMA